MALRPVSELGLVDLTDLAEPGKSGKAPAKARKPKVAKAARREIAKPQAATPAQPKAATPARTKAPSASRRKAASVARTGMVVATWTAAGACGIVLGRAAVRR
jgi:hypothetical protein